MPSSSIVIGPPEIKFPKLRDIQTNQTSPVSPGSSEVNRLDPMLHMKLSHVDLGRTVTFPYCKTRRPPPNPWIKTSPSNDSASCDCDGKRIGWMFGVNATLAIILRSARSTLSQYVKVSTYVMKLVRLLVSAAPNMTSMVYTGKLKVNFNTSTH